MIIPKEEVEKAAWESIKPAININNPEKSDGYNEWEVYISFMNGTQFLETKLKEISIEFARFIKDNPKLVEDSILTVLEVNEYDNNYIAPRHFDNFEKLFDKFIKDKHD